MTGERDYQIRLLTSSLEAFVVYTTRVPIGDNGQAGYVPILCIAA
jgi:hypothetical protein